MKKVKCNICGYEFESIAQDKNIRCPKCKSNQSFGIRKNLLSSAAMAFMIILFLCSCSELDLLRVDEAVQDVNAIGQGTQAVLESPAGQLIPLQLKLYGALGVIIVNGLVIGWEEWRNRTMKKTTRAIVKGIEKSDNPDETSIIKKNIASEMVAQGGDKFYSKANRIVDKLKIS